MVGKHYILDIVFDELNYVKDDVWLPILINACKNNVTILNIIDHVFNPHGYSCCILLSESHISVHTFPEKKLVCIDIFTCNVYRDTNIEKIVEKIIEKIIYKSLTVNVIERGKSL